MAYRYIKNSVCSNFNCTLQLTKIHNTSSLLSSNFIRNYFCNSENRNVSRKESKSLQTSSLPFSELLPYSGPGLTRTKLGPSLLRVDNLRSNTIRNLTRANIFVEETETKDKKSDNSEGKLSTTSANFTNATESKVNRNYLAFNLKQVKDRASAPKQNVKLRYASDPNYYFEPRSVSRNQPKGNFSNNNVLILIKEELLEINVIKDKLTCVPHPRKCIPDRQPNVQTKEDSAADDVSECDSSQFKNKNVCAALIVLPQEAYAVKQEPEEDLKHLDIQK